VASDDPPHSNEEVPAMTIRTASLRVGDLMTLDPIVIEPSAPAAEAESLL